VLALRGQRLWFMPHLLCTKGWRWCCDLLSQFRTILHHFPLSFTRQNSGPNSAKRNASFRRSYRHGGRFSACGGSSSFYFRCQEPPTPSFKSTVVLPPLRLLCIYSGRSHHRQPMDSRIFGPRRSPTYLEQPFFDIGALLLSFRSTPAAALPTPSALLALHRRQTVISFHPFRRSCANTQAPLARTDESFPILVGYTLIHSRTEC